MITNNAFAFFDFDYTLAKTSESIRVFSPRGTRKDKQGRLYRPIYAPEYNTLKLASDETIEDASFVEFDSLNVKKSKPIKQIIFFYKLLFSQCKETHVVSARPQAPEQDICNFLQLATGIEQSKHRYYGCESSDPLKKSGFIESTLKGKEVNQVWLFDDSENVINHYVDLYSSNKVYNIIRVCHRNGLQLHFKSGDLGYNI